MLPSICATQYKSDYHASDDVSTVLDTDGVQYYQEVIGILLRPSFEPLSGIKLNLQDLIKVLFHQVLCMQSYIFKHIMNHAKIFKKI